MVQALNAGDFAAAAQAGRNVLRLTPDDPAIHHNLGFALAQISETEGALKHARRAVQLAPRNAQFRQGEASILVQLNRFEEAVKACEAGLQVIPEAVDLIGYLAELLVMGHRHEDAAALLAPHLDREPPAAAILLSYARLAPRINEEVRAIELLRDFVDHAATSDEMATRALFRLGSLLDRAARYGEAFDAVDRANRRAPGRYDPAQTSRAFEQLVRLWNEGACRAAPTSGLETDKPVFIVSVPRSGSTLVEQIIGAHSHVDSVGEWRGIPVAAEQLRRRQGGAMLDPQRLKPQHLKEAARNYLNGLAVSGTQIRHVTDKMLTNFQHLGLISRLFPSARIISCVRHPFDVAISCYFQDFTAGNPWARSLRGMALFRRDYDRVMAHWRDVISNPILEVSYERLVADQEAETRRIIEFVGLPWEDDCLEFQRNRRIAMTASNQQVREKMYHTSVHRYRNYRSHLDPVREVLGDPEAFE